MKITVSAQSPLRGKCDIVFFAVGPRWRTELASTNEAVEGRILDELARQGFQGTPGQSAVFQTHGSAPAPYLVAVGVGDGAGCSPWYSCAQSLVSRAAGLKATNVVLALPGSGDRAAAIESLAEGLLLSDYRFNRLKSRDSGAARLATVKIAAGSASADDRRALARGQSVARATCYARDIINLPADVATPTFLAREARTIGRDQRLTVRVFDEAAIKRLGMNALLGVARGSAQPPRFLELVYKPARKASRSVALVGKGVTFDSGGLSLKPAGSMESMKRDMAGAAAVLGVMSAIRDLAPTVEVRAYVPTTENMPGGKAIKPGDVVTALNGKTIEVLNTDAEGRLILADAMSYAVRKKPDLMIDVATLTGAVRAALGPRYAAILGTDRRIVADLIAAGQHCGENLWELPLVDEYRSDIESSVADIKNVGNGYAGTITAALFLREFIGDIPWAHIDFSSTVVVSKPFAGHPAGASGFGVRTLLRYLASA